jgi:parvulin-like peptidyl-prolyl isomerase
VTKHRSNLASARIVLVSALAFAAIDLARSRVAVAQPPASAGAPPIDQAPGEPENAIVAHVGPRTIDRRAVERLAERTLAGRATTAQERPPLLAAALESLVRQGVVHDYVDRTEHQATAAEVDAALAEQRRRIETLGESMETWLSARGQSEAQYREQLSWEIGWRRYLAATLSDDVLARYFETHRRDFDGTEVRASHVLLPFAEEAPAAGQRDQQLAALVGQATAIRDRILAGEFTFDQAVREYSKGPSRDQEGDLGFIPRRGPMVEEFSRAAFALEVGQLSEPIVSPFGVHLIRVSEIRPGAKTLADVRDELSAAAAGELLGRLAERHRPQVEVRYTGAIAHIDPATGALAPTP